MYSSKIEIEKFAKNNLIKQFIKENKRIPNSGELNDLLKDKYKIDIDKYGYQETITLPKINEESSYEEINKMLFNFHNNNNFLFDQLKELFSKISERSFIINAYSSLLEKQLQNLNSKATTYMLSKGYNSNLLSSVTEDFINDSKLILSESDVSCSTNGIQASLDTYSDNTNYISNISYSVFSDSSYNKSINYGNLNSLKTKDGDYWQVDVYTDYKSGNISVQLEIELSELINISSVKFFLSSYTGLSMSLYIASEDKNYSYHSSQGVNSDLCEFFINYDVKYLKLLLVNNTANVSTDKDFIYSFKLDSIELTSSSINNDCEFVCGPYQFLDYLNNNINFNFVQLETCSNAVDQSSIDYYISTDKSNWISISPKNTFSSGTVISINSNITNVNAEVIDDTLGLTNLDYNNVGDILTKQTDCYLNFTLSDNYIDNINSNNISIKRNIPNEKEIYLVNSGWYFDEENNLYKTTIEINNIEGITLDFGNSSIYLDGILMSGNILISSGVHTFWTSQNNWLSIDPNLTTEQEIISADPLYPYNHKLLIEGYTYPSTYSGNKIYNGVDIYYAKSIKYVNKTEFDMDKYNLDIFTSYIKDDTIYFIVHVLNSYEDWINEEFEINVSIPSDTNSTIYLKGKFRTNSLTTEILKNFTLRVG